MSGENRIAEQVDAVGNRANGVAVHYEYAPFGEVTAQVRRGGVTAYDFAALNPWRFSSEYVDDALACDYYNYRHCEPVTGRWLSRDPIDEDGGLNLYLYCENGMDNDVDGLIKYDPCCESIKPECENDLDEIRKELAKIEARYMSPTMPDGLSREDKKLWRAKYARNPIWREIWEIYKKYGLVDASKNSLNVSQIWKSAKEFREGIQKIKHDIDEKSGSVSVICLSGSNNHICDGTFKAGLVVKGGWIYEEYKGKIIVCPEMMKSGAKYERSIENAMIEMQRVLLKGITGRVCKGYDVN